MRRWSARHSINADALLQGKGWDECVDEAYAILPPEAKNPAFAPGFNMAQLQTDLQAVAS
jgi:hypothetical protein